MAGYRGELRVFGLLAFAGLAVFGLYKSLTVATVNGKVLGIGFTIGGPAALLLVLILVFSWRGLLTFEVKASHEDALARPVDRMTRDQALRAADDLQAEANAIERRRVVLLQYAEGLSRGESVDVAMAAIGMRPARRHPVVE